MIPTDSSGQSSAAWRRITQVLFAIVLAGMILIGLLAVGVHHARQISRRTADSALEKRIKELELQVERLQQEQAMPSLVLRRYRNSVGYIQGVYRVGFADQRPQIRVAFSGTGFLVGDRLVATNRHVAEPWYKDSEAQALIGQGAVASLETIAIYFPESVKPVRLSRVATSKITDLAVLRAEDPAATRGLATLPLAETSGPAGGLVILVGYPMGVAGMVAKSPSTVYERLASRHSPTDTVHELAAQSLIRPSVTWGHLGDVIGDKLIYDAPTAHGASGSPVFNAKGEVIGVNFGFMGGSGGDTFGESVEFLKPLLLEAQPAH